MTEWVGGWMDTDLMYPTKKKPQGFLAQITPVSIINGLKCMFRLYHSHWTLRRQEAILMIELYSVEMQWH